MLFLECMPIFVNIWSSVKCWTIKIMLSVLVRKGRNAVSYLKLRTHHGNRRLNCMPINKIVVNCIEVM